MKANPARAFDVIWFERNQRALLWLFNKIRPPCFRLLPYEMVRITPSGITYRDGDGFVSTVFSRPYFSELIYRHLKPLWWLLHAWDWAIADRFITSLSYQFHVLTAVPQPDVADGVTHDGFVGRAGVNETLSTIRTGAGTTAGNIPGANNSAAQITASVTTDQFANLIRAIYTFDTSLIGVADVVDSVLFSVVGTDAIFDLGTADLHVVGATPASNKTFVSSDYGQVQSTSFGSVSGASYTTDGFSYNDIALNASGMANVITGTGAISRFATRLNWDIDNNFAGVWVSGAVTRLNINFTDVNRRPKLTINWHKTGIIEPAIKLRPGIFRPGIAR